MKFEDMKQRVQKIEKLKDELITINLLCDFKNFAGHRDVCFLANQNNVFNYCQPDILDKIIHADLIRALAQKRRIEINEEIMELESDINIKTKELI